MTEDGRALSVKVALTPPLFSSVEAAAVAVRQRIEAEVSELLLDLGLPSEAEVQLEAIDPPSTTDLIRLSFSGQPCRFPRTTVAEALAYVDGTAQAALDDNAALARLQGSDGSIDRVAELLALVCRAGVSAQPGILVAPTDDAAVRAAVSLGMSVAGREVAEETGADSGDRVERFIAARQARTIDVHIDRGYLRALSADEAAGELFRFMRDGLFVELGLPLPPFHFRPDASLRPGAFAFRLNAMRTLPRIGLPTGTILVNDTPERLALLNVEADATLNPATHYPAALVSQEHKDELEAVGLTTWTPSGFFILSFAAEVRRSAHALMTLEVASRMVQQIELAFPFLEGTARSHAPPDALAPVLRDLLLDHVPVRNLRRILELVLRYETGGAPNGGWPDRVAFVRSGMADIIASKFARGTDTVVVYLLDPQIEDALAEHGDGTAPTDAEEPLLERLSAAVRAELSELPRTAQTPSVITREELRRPLRAVLRHEFPHMAVLAYEDLPPDFNVQPVARISWA